jgi:hypothetical protein
MYSVDARYILDSMQISGVKLLDDTDKIFIKALPSITGLVVQVIFMFVYNRLNIGIGHLS